MPVVNIEENIKKIKMNIEQMTQEVFRLQGMLTTFTELKKGGLKIIDLPNDPHESEQTEELESIQEKPE
jgi:hypothetical protein